MKQTLMATIVGLLLTDTLFAGQISQQSVRVPLASQAERDPDADQPAADDGATPELKRAFLRVALRERLAGEERGSRKKLLRRLLADDDLQTIAIAYAEHRQSQEPTLAAEDEEGRFLQFFQWIIEHQDEIIAFIEKLIALFDSVAVNGVSRGYLSLS